jgi:hypothetical protein
LFWGALLGCGGGGPPPPPPPPPAPPDRILAETDSPYLAPQPVRGRPNEPAYVVHTLAALAEARGEDPAELERQIDANATACFWPNGTRRGLTPDMAGPDTSGSDPGHGWTGR